MLNKLLSVLRAKTLQDILKLTAGTIGGRLIALVSMPFITRLYTPAEFTLLSIYLSLVTTISVVAALRFEIAIPIVKNDDEASSLLVISFISLFLTVILVSVISLIFPKEITLLIASPDFEKYLYLVPIGIIILSSYSILQYWCTRLKNFGLISFTKVSQSFVGALVMLLTAYSGLSPIGLLIGMSISSAGGSGLLAKNSLLGNKEVFKGINIAKLISVFKKNSAYPKYSTFEAFANTAGYQIPILLIASKAGNDAGHLFIAMQVMNVPMALLGRSLSQVYLSKVPSKLASNELKSFTLEIIKKLTVLSVPTFLFLSIISPTLFEILFGEPWRRAGEIVRIIMPWIMIQFIVSPISMILHITNNQFTAMWLQFFGLIIRLGGLTLVTYLEFGHIIESYSALSAIFYSLYLYIILRIIKKTTVSAKTHYD